MPVTTAQQASRLFKKLFGLAETTTVRQFFEESFKGRTATWPSSVIGQESDIPTTAPAGMINDQTIGVVKRKIDLVLTAVPGTTNSFYHADLIDAIPFNFGDGSYNYALKDSTNTSISFGQNDWLVDTEAGVLTFYTSVPANMPPKISFYKYVGIKGITASAIVPQVETANRTIYVETTGSDTTGNGLTVGTAFATLYKAITTIKPQIYNCKITIQLGIGAFVYDAACDLALYKIQHLYGGTTFTITPLITIQGLFTLYRTGTFTIDSTDKNKHNVSDLNVYTTNELKNKFAFATGSIYIPINSNTSTYISDPCIAITTLSNTYDLSTTLSVTSAIIASSVLQYLRIDTLSNTSLVIGMQSNTTTYITNKTSVCILSCMIYSSLNVLRFINIESCELSISSSIVDVSYAAGTSRFGILNYRANAAKFVDFQYIILRNLSTANASRNGSGIYTYFYNATGFSGYGIIIENVYTAFNLSASCVLNGSGNNIIGVTVNNAYAIYCSEEPAQSGYKSLSIRQNNKLALNSVDYLFHLPYNSAIIANNVNYSGTILGLFSPGTVNKKMIDLSIGQIIKVNGFYQEYETGKINTLTYNTVTNIAIGDKTQNESIVINYTLSRGTNRQQGKIQILEGGLASPLISEDYQNTADLGVTFDAAYDGVLTTQINLACTVNNQEINNATLKYNIERVRV